MATGPMLVTTSVQAMTTEESYREVFGFRSGNRGTMTSRTIMLEELTLLFEATPDTATKAERWAEIIENNILGKRTAATRKLTAQRLSELYGLDASIPLFRLLQFFWRADPTGQPLLALLCACARDPLLRMTASPVLKSRIGEAVKNEQLEAAVAANTDNRFNPQTLDQIGRNAASSWTQSGHLTGRSNKRRSKPRVTVGSTTYALLLGYLAGARGQFLFSSFWSRLLDEPEYILHEHAREAAANGWMNYRRIDDILEINFSSLLTPRERAMLDE